MSLLKNLPKKTKSFFIIGLLFLFTLFVVIPLGFGCIFKGDIETFTSKVTKTKTSLSRFFLSPFSGRGTISKFFISNPKGFDTNFSIQGKRLKISLKPQSLFKDVVSINHLTVSELEIMYEYKKRKNNISVLQRNISKSRQKEGWLKNKGKSQPSKLIIHNLVINNAKVSWFPNGMAIKPIPFELSNIHLNDLGLKQRGIGGEKIIELLLQNIQLQITQKIQNHGKK